MNRKATIQNGFEKTRETVIKAIGDKGKIVIFFSLKLYSFTFLGCCGFEKYRSLLRTIDELDGIMKGLWNNLLMSDV